MNNRHLRELEALTANYASVLRDVLPRVGDEDRARIQNALATGPPRTPTSSRRSSLVSSISATTDDSPTQAWSPTFAKDTGIADPASSASPFPAASEYCIDPLSESSSIAGKHSSNYQGLGSEASWFHLLRKELLSYQAYESEQEALADIALVLHSARRPILSLAGPVTDAFALPSKPIADSLTSLYFDAVHPVIPIISQLDFMKQYNILYQTANPREQSNHWLGVVNVVCAISQRYLEGHGKTAGVDHVSLFKRSGVLSALEGRPFSGDPDLDDVQALSLAGLYLMSIKQINQAWNIIGFAVRIAQGLGLHCAGKSSGPVSEELSQLRTRVWYSVVYLEAKICHMTARPSAIPRWTTAADASKPRDLSSAFYTALADISRLESSIQVQLYSNQDFQLNATNWAMKHKAIHAHEAELDNWRASLPAELHDNRVHSEGKRASTREVSLRFCVDLALHSLGVRILIFFPCLCALKSMNQPGSPQDGAELACRGAAECIMAARAISRIIIDYSQREEAIALLPWWCVAHHLVCAEVITILYILSIPLEPGAVFELLEAAKQSLLWLHRFSQTDPVAASTYDWLQKLLLLTENLVIDGSHQYRQNSMLLDTPEQAMGIPAPTGVSGFRPAAYPAVEAATAKFGLGEGFFQNAAAMPSSEPMEPESELEHTAYLSHPHPRF